jgi:hypothetical protein
LNSDTELPYAKGAKESRRDAKGIPLNGKRPVPFWQVGNLLPPIAGVAVGTSAHLTRNPRNL